MYVVSRKEENKGRILWKESTKSKSLINSTRIVIDNFDKFCKSEYTHDSDDVINELLSFDVTKLEDSTCDLYQNWINYNAKNGISAKTLKVYFSLLKSYLHYRGIKVSEKDIKTNVSLPKVIHEKKHPLNMEQIHEILKIANCHKKSLYLALLSSGMRIGEAVQIRKKDLEILGQRITINIPTQFTKTKTSRTVYISIESSKMILGKLKELDDDSLIWGTNPDYSTSVFAEDSAFSRYVDKIGLGVRYESGTRKIALHSFRAFFFTKSARIHGENYAHMMTGHGGYLMEYDRLTDEEKLEMYLELEPNLLVYDQTINEQKIKKLRDANTKLTDQQITIEDQEKRLKKLEEMLYLERNFQREK